MENQTQPINKKLKICFVSIFAYPLFNPDCKSRFGGAEVQMVFWAKELAKNKDLKIDFIVGDFGQAAEEIHDQLRVYKSYPLKKTLKNYILATSKLKKLLNKINPEVIISRAHGIETYICAKYCKKNQKKFIYSIAHENDINGKHAKGLVGLFFNSALKKADYFIAQNQSQVELFEKWKGQKINNIQIIKSGYPIEDISKINKEFVLWVARAEKWKRPEIYIQLAENFPQQNFIMIMPKSSDIGYWQKIKNQAEKIRNLKFIEKVPFLEVDGYFKKALIFVNTSEKEGFPNAFIQAAKNKTPILSLAVNPDNFINQYNCGLFSENNPEKFNQQFEQIIKNPSLAEKLGENGLNYAQSQHDIKKNTEKLLNLILSLLK